MPHTWLAGDFNMSADRCLAAAKPLRCHPTVLITESTFATTLREGKRYARPASWHQCIAMVDAEVLAWRVYAGGGRASSYG